MGGWVGRAGCPCILAPSSCAARVECLLCRGFRLLPLCPSRVPTLFAASLAAFALPSVSTPRRGSARPSVPGLPA
eukprot:556869-Alexandrium_andersonii.AAC.1